MMLFIPRAPWFPNIFNYVNANFIYDYHKSSSWVINISVFRLNFAMILHLFHQKFESGVDDDWICTCKTWTLMYYMDINVYVQCLIYILYLYMYM